MNLNHRTRLLRMAEKEIKYQYDNFQFREVENLITIVEETLGFRLKANELREQYL